MARRYETISFLTDYGLIDEFVGVVKSVVRDIAAHVTVIDITHEVPVFDVRAGSLTLARAISYVPSGVVLAVVDPGVGTSRKSIAIEVGDGEGVLVGPDNGLLAPAVAMAGGAGRAVVLSNTEYHLIAPGATFAGRDIFAPAAAHLCNGVDLYELGDPIDAELLMPGVIPLPRPEGDALITEVLWVDRFGNCQLNVGPGDVAHLGDTVKVTVGELTGAPMTRIAKLASSFFELGSGAVGLVTDSYGMLALCLDRRSAAQELHIDASDQVVLESVGDHDSARGSVTSPVNLRINR
jgi:hypothetical protein